ncbi:uncharacterized protein [Halyomorpha halys]|uniref:uncharacterized protein n=1 Tax=Halyomorpha halys TaxID=286706 RepID=UPI0006D4F0BD|nr:uncharacterized protein LOC106692980 [Halyomorpha halys]
MIKVLLSRITLVLIIALLESRCEGRRIDDNYLIYDTTSKNDYNQYLNNSCKCEKVGCECCSVSGPSRVCNSINFLSVEEEPALELSVRIGKSKIFSQYVTLRELEPLCYPYGDYNLCVQVENVKSQQENDQVCGHFLAKHKAYDDVEESILVKTQIFCLPFENYQLNKHVLQLLRFVSQ